MTISPVEFSDIERITALQNRLLLPVANPEDGFLVSAFSDQQYSSFIQEYEFFYKAEQDGELLGVLMAYKAKHITPDNVNNSLLSSIVIGDFVLIKQIFLAPESGGKGAANALYRHLFAQAGESLPYVCVIVVEPFNKRSCDFHVRMGFSEFLGFTPEPDKDGIVRKRTAWIRPPRGKDDIHPYLRLSNAGIRDDEGEVLASRASTLVELYQHEDNLNWTKFGMQTTVLFALFACFAYFYERQISEDAMPVLVVLGIWGAVVNLLFMLKIYSGIHYMNAYKHKIQECDNMLTFYYPRMPRVFYRHEYIARRSITSRLMLMFSLMGLLSWSSLALMLVFKALRMYIIF